MANDNPTSSDQVIPAAGNPAPYLQNRELSWLDFNERVLEQGADESVPLLQRLNFISIFWSNLQEFFMVRVGSLTDLSLVKKHIVDSKSNMTPSEQLRAIYLRCHELYPAYERTFEQVRLLLNKVGVTHVRPDELTDEQRSYLAEYAEANVTPFLSPQIINARHPFPHLENGALYIVVRLDEEADNAQDQTKSEHKKKGKKGKKGKGKPAKESTKNASLSQNVGAEGTLLGLIPLPRQCARVVKLPGDGFSFILLEHVVEMVAEQVFSMYTVKHTNVICVTRNADIDATESTDENDEDYREHMKRILKKRARLAPVRLESERELSDTLEPLLLDRLNLKKHEVFTTSVPLDLSFTWGLASHLSEKQCAALMYPPFTPQWPACLDRKRPIMDQVTAGGDVLLSYPYESMDPFVQLLREASRDPRVISIKITLYRLASQSHLAEALIDAAENGKEVTALFELRARFDESNNIEWSQRFEQAGCNVIYGFRDYKVHSKICCITRQTDDGIQHITQLGTGNYNEKTAKLYTDLSMITADPVVGQDAARFFRSMQLESASSDYKELRVAPLMIKPRMCEAIDGEIAKAKAGKPARILMKSNAITDRDMIEKLTEASRAGVKITMLVRGISCLVPGIPGKTENIRIVSVVGRLLEHSRIYAFGVGDETTVFLSSADLMTRNLDKRVEIAWPVNDPALRARVLDYFTTMLSDTAKLRELQSDGTFTDLCAFVPEGRNPFDAQDHLIKEAYIAAERARATGLTSPRFIDAAVGGTPATAPTLSSAMADMAEDAKEDFVTAEEIEQSEGGESEATVEAEAETASENEAETEPQAETETKGKHAAVEANPDSLEKAPLEIAIDDEPKKEDAKVSIEAKMPTACAAPAAAQTKKPQPAPTPKKKGFFARLFGR